MTEEEFKNRKFGHSQLLDYVHYRTKTRISGCLMSVNFDSGVFQLWIFPQIVEDVEYPEQEVFVYYEYVFPSKITLKKV